MSECGSESSRAAALWTRGLTAPVLPLAAGLLIVLALASYRRPFRDSDSHPPQPCRDHLRRMGLALKQYAQDWDEAYPAGLGALYPDYLDDPGIFSCASNPSPCERIRQTGRVRPAYTSYVYVSGLDDLCLSACVLAYDRPGNHGEDGVNVLFLDTHVEWCAFGEFEQRLARTRALAAESGRKLRLVGE